MSFDISKYAADVVNSTSKSIDRDFIGEGDHIVKIESVIGMTSQNTGNDLVIIEGEIIATKNGQHSRGDKVKQIFTLSGVPSWKVKETVGILKSIVTACLPTGTEVTEEMVSKALTGGAESLLVGDAVRVMARKKVSKAGKTSSASLTTASQRTSSIKTPTSLTSPPPTRPARPPTSTTTICPSDK
jgi:hypothetical protein